MKKIFALFLFLACALPVLATDSRVNIDASFGLVPTTVAASGVLNKLEGFGFGSGDAAFVCDGYYSSGGVTKGEGIIARYRVTAVGTDGSPNGYTYDSSFSLGAASSSTYVFDAAWITSAQEMAVSSQTGNAITLWDCNPANGTYGTAVQTITTTTPGLLAPRTLAGTTTLTSTFGNSKTTPISAIHSFSLSGTAGSDISLSAGSYGIPLPMQGNIKCIAWSPDGATFYLVDSTYILYRFAVSGTTGTLTGFIGDGFVTPAGDGSAWTGYSIVPQSDGTVIGIGGGNPGPLMRASADFTTVTCNSDYWNTNVDAALGSGNKLGYDMHGRLWTMEYGSTTGQSPYTGTGQHLYRPNVTRLVASPDFTPSHKYVTVYNTNGYGWNPVLSVTSAHMAANCLISNADSTFEPITLTCGLAPSLRASNTADGLVTVYCANAQGQRQIVSTATVHFTGILDAGQNQTVTFTPVAAGSYSIYYSVVPTGTTGPVYTSASQFLDLSPYELTQGPFNMPAAIPAPAFTSAGGYGPTIGKQLYFGHYCFRWDIAQDDIELGTGLVGQPVLAGCTTTSIVTNAAVTSATVGQTLTFSSTSNTMLLKGFVTTVTAVSGSAPPYTLTVSPALPAVPTVYTAPVVTDNFTISTVYYSGNNVHNEINGLVPNLTLGVTNHLSQFVQIDSAAWLHLERSVGLPLTANTPMSSGNAIMYDWGHATSLISGGAAIPFETSNEPNNHGVGTPWQIMQGARSMRAKLKAANPSALLIGPDIDHPTPGTMAQAASDGFLSGIYADTGSGGDINTPPDGTAQPYPGGTGTYYYTGGAGGNAHTVYDALSYHDYTYGNLIDYWLSHKNVQGMRAIMAANGDSTKPLWMTEWGTISQDQGAAMLFSQPVNINTMLETAEQDGCPEAHVNYYYTYEGGYKNQPFWVWSYQGPLPSAVMLRVRNALIGNFNSYGMAVPSSTIDFSGTGDTTTGWVMFGETFPDPSGSGTVILYHHQGVAQDGTYAWNVTGTSSLNVYDWAGNKTVVPVSGGVAQVPVGPLPTYIRVPAGATCTPQATVFGTNLAASASTISYFGADGVTAGNTYHHDSNSSSAFFGADNKGWLTNGELNTPDTASFYYPGIYPPTPHGFGGSQWVTQKGGYAWTAQIPEQNSSTDTTNYVTANFIVPPPATGPNPGGFRIDQFGFLSYRVYPAYVEVDWPTAQTLGTVALWSCENDTGFETVTDLALQYWNGSAWVSVSEITPYVPASDLIANDNTSTAVDYYQNRFAFLWQLATPITTTKIRYAVQGVSRGNQYDDNAQATFFAAGHHQTTPAKLIVRQLGAYAPAANGLLLSSTAGASGGTGTSGTVSSPSYTPRTDISRTGTAQHLRSDLPAVGYTPRTDISRTGHAAHTRTDITP